MNGNPIREPPQNKTIINLSETHRLTAEQNSLLTKGLSFIPTSSITHFNKNDAIADVTNYHRKLKIAAYFGPPEDETRTPFLPPSDWEPPWPKVPISIKQLIQQDHNDTLNMKIPPHAPTPNLSVEENAAITQLTNNQNIVIKPADKGSVIVIMDRTHYVTEALRQLSDETFYKPLRKPIYTESIPLIHDLLDDLNQQGFINKKQMKYLKGETKPKKRHFYLLPKIHKPKTSWPSPHMAPGRPIVSDCGSESYRIAEFLDYYLNPLSTLHRSYIKDTYTFIEKIKSTKIKENAFLFTIDIDSLYTNIETTLGLQAVKDIFKAHPDPNRPDKALLKFLTLSLEKNDFEFDGKFYLQIKGTAMGKKFAPAYANIYMAQWEETILPKCSKTPDHYFRYLDDIWGTWSHSKEEFAEFIHALNNHHRSIKVKFSLQTNAVDFLDTTTYKGPDFNQTKTLDIKVFFKETDTHALLHKSSFHPKHTFTGIVKSQLLRFHRICTQHTDFIAATKTLFQALRHRGYSRQFLRKTYKQWEEDQHKGGIPLEPQIAKGIIPLILPYSKPAKILAKRIKDNFNELCQNTPWQTEWQIMPAYRRHKNLKDLLVRSKLPHLRKPLKTHPRYNLVKNHTTGITYRRSFHPLSVENNIYLITCRKCKKQYVGQTKNSILTRMQAHRYNVSHNKKKGTHLVAHFQRHGTAKMSVLSLEHNPNWTLRERLHKEWKWINKLNTIYPNGLNQKAN